MSCACIIVDHQHVVYDNVTAVRSDGRHLRIWLTTQSTTTRENVFVWPVRLDGQTSVLLAATSEDLDAMVADRLHGDNGNGDTDTTPENTQNP